MAILEAEDRSRIIHTLDYLSHIAGMMESELYESWKYKDMESDYPIIGEETVFSPHAIWELYVSFYDLDDFVKRLPNNDLLPQYVSDFKESVKDLLNDYLIVRDIDTVLNIQTLLACIISEGVIALIEDDASGRNEKKKDITDWVICRE